MFTSTSTNANKEERPEEQKNNEIVKEEKIENTLDSIDNMLDRERQKNKMDNWIKLDKTAKLQRLHTFAESYGKQHNMPPKDVKILKNFFKDCLDKNKLAKSKDIVYNKEEMKIISIPSLLRLVISCMISSLIAFLLPIECDTVSLRLLTPPVMSENVFIASVTELTNDFSSLAFSIGFIKSCLSAVVIFCNAK